MNPRTVTYADPITRTVSNDVVRFDLGPHTLHSTVAEPPPVSRGMADLTPELHDTRASYPPEWTDLTPKLNRAQRRARGDYQRADATVRSIR